MSACWPQDISGCVSIISTKKKWILAAKRVVIWLVGTATGTVAHSDECVVDSGQFCMSQISFSLNKQIWVHVKGKKDVLFRVNYVKVCLDFRSFCCIMQHLDSSRGYLQAFVCVSLPHWGGELSAGCPLQRLICLTMDWRTVKHYKIFFNPFSAL